MYSWSQNFSNDKQKTINFWAAVSHSVSTGEKTKEDFFLVFITASLGLNKPWLQKHLLHHVTVAMTNHERENVTSWICISVSFLSLWWNILEHMIVRTQQHKTSGTTQRMWSLWLDSLVNCTFLQSCPACCTLQVPLPALLHLPQQSWWSCLATTNEPRASPLTERGRKKNTPSATGSTFDDEVCAVISPSACKWRFRINGGTLIRLQLTGKRLCSLMSSFSHALKTVSVSLVTHLLNSSKIKVHAAGKISIVQRDWTAKLKGVGEFQIKRIEILLSLHALFISDFCFIP